MSNMPSVHSGGMFVYLKTIDLNILLVVLTTKGGTPCKPCLLLRRE